MKRLLQSWLRTLLQVSRLSNRGFTLTELLIVTIVGSIIMTGLLTMVVQLMSVDRQENVRMETNREMQMAMDYMSTELREAVYVYTGHCLMAQADADADLTCNAGSRAIGNPGGVFFPNTGASAIASASDVPVLVFWKQKPIPAGLRATCDDVLPNVPQIAGQTIPCLTGSSYALVVYALSTDNTGGTWRGRARIKRYELQEFTTVGAAFQRSTGYLNPTQNANNFIAWPYTAAPTRATGQATVLVDFVDGPRRADEPANNIVDAPVPASCPAGYSISPHAQALQNAGNVPNNLRSFYACVTPSIVGGNQEVLLYLQGNVAGRTNVGTRTGNGALSGRLSVLQTRVMTRGVLNAR